MKELENTGRTFTLRDNVVHDATSGMNDERAASARSETVRKGGNEAQGSEQGYALLNVVRDISEKSVLTGIRLQ